MIALIIFLVLIALIFFVPYGIDASYQGGQAKLCVRAGPVSVCLWPKKPLTEKQQERARKKKEKKDAKAAAKKAEKEKKKQEQPPEQTPDQTIKVKKDRELDMETLLALLEMGMHAIRRFFRSFSVDYFKLHCTVAGSDPYNTAMEYGYLWYKPYADRQVYAAIGDSGNIIYVNKEENVAVGVTGTFKPRIFDRVQFIEEKVLPILEPAK